MKEQLERSGVVIGAGGLIVLGTIAACVGGAAPVPQRIEVAVAAIVAELYVAVGAAQDRAWAIALVLVDLGALVIAFRIHHTTDKLLLGIPAIGGLALAVIHAITFQEDDNQVAPPPPPPAPPAAIAPEEV